MIQIYIDVIDDSGELSKDSAIELLVPTMPIKDNFFIFKEKDGQLSEPHLVSHVTFFEEDNKQCGVCVYLKKPVSSQK